MASIRSRIGENMEDRYLFKAKRLDNGEWVTGQYVNTCYPKDCKKTGHFIVKYPNHLNEIYTSTICQCTGLKDKNGKLIWENDVVKATVRQNSLCQSSSYSDFYQISYQEKYCYFYLKKKNNNLLFDGNWSYYLKSIEVIGNIFDNPELLESEEII